MEKFSFKSLLTIIVVLLIGIVGLWQIQRRARPAAAWFNDSWQYRKAITIGNTDSQVNNAQIQVLTDYDISSLVSAGKIGSSLNDIRFTDTNGQLLHYWIQDYTNNSVNIWILIPKLLSGTQKIYMYYGNSSAKENSESHWVADLGGTISSFNGYRIHAFLNNDTYTNLVDRQADVLVIAGGGGGGRRHGAGGGAGGLIYQTNFSITSDIGVTVGAGGLGATSVQNPQNGSNSTFSSLTAIGGGFGGSYDASRDGASGGSGGGSTTLNVAVGTVGQGNSGGTGYTASSPYNWGGGGGAGEAGHNGTSNSHGNGGDGLYYGDLYSTGYGESGWFAGGGGGGGHDPAATYQGIGGTGGGGNGGTPGVNTPGEDGQVNTGGGGGGAATSSGGGSKGGDGGSGIVLVRYQSTINTPTGNSISSPATEEQSPAPIAYWKFDEGVGTTAYDSTINHNNGVFGAGTSAPTWQNEDMCIVGKCLNFDGNDLVSVIGTTNISSYTNSRSVSVWFKINTSGTQRAIISTGEIPESTKPLWLLVIRNTDVLSIYHGGSYREGTTTIQSGKWYHAEYTYNSSNNSLALYLNGKIEYSGTHAESVGSTENQNIYIGEGYNHLFNGIIDDVKIYKYARTASQIKQDYNAGKANIGALEGGAVNIGGTQVRNIKDNLIAHYKFDEGQGTVANNSGISGIGFSGVFGIGNSAPSWSNNGKFGKALDFDGSNDYVNLTGIGDSGITHTISFWANSRNSSNNGKYVLDVQSGRILVGWGSDTAGQIGIYDGTWRLFGNSPSANIWHYLTFVLDGSTSKMKMYLNGTQYGSELDYTPSAIGGSVAIGSRYSMASYRFNGLIDDVKIYNIALTADEVKLDYNQGAQFVMGKSNQTIGGTTTNLDYCIPGDTTACSAPVAEWKFEEGVGTTTYDTSGNNYHGVFSTGNSAPTWTTGKIGKGLSFDKSDYVNHGDVLDMELNDMTISTWIKSSDTGSSSQYIISKARAANQNYRYGVYLKSGRAGIFMQGDGGSDVGITSNTSVTDNKWHNLSFIFDRSSSASIYIDGVYDTSGTISQWVSANMNSDNPFRIGSYTANDSVTASGFFNGKLDNIRVYNYARTPAQIAYDYNKGGPIAHWKFDECQGSTVYDSSGVGNTGTITIGAGGSQVSLGTCGAGDTTAWSNGSTGKINSALNFDGTDDRISVSAISSNLSNSFSFSAWLKVTATKNTVQSAITSEVASYSNYYISMETYSNKYCFNLYDGSNNPVACTNDNYTLNEWVHIVGVRNTTTDKIYIYKNGILQGSGTTDTTTSTPTYSAFYLGAQVNVANRYFPGYIDDVRIYNYALTSEQVKQIYNGGAVNFR